MEKTESFLMQEEASEPRKWLVNFALKVKVQI